MLRVFGKFLLIIVVLLAPALAPEAEGQLSANGKSLVVTTANAVATFAGADLVGFQNRLTSEIYLKKPSSGELAAVNPVQGTGQTLQVGNWAIGVESGTGDPLASIMISDSVRTLTVTVKIDAASQEVVLKSGATVSTPGLRDASWSIAGLDFAAGHWIVPARTGEVYDAARPPVGDSLQYPRPWNAQMAVYETAQGSFILYSTDAQYQTKDLRTTTRGALTADIAVVTEAIGPYGTASSVPTIEWRLKAFAGDWKTAAQVYKTWLSTNRPPVSNSAHPWVQDIRTVVTVHALDQAILAPLAALLAPSKTLLYIVEWRTSGFDNNYPDYTPRAGVAEFINAAHLLGFKVMLHCNLIGVSPDNPDYASVQAYQLRDPGTLALMGWQWDLPTSTPGRFAFIDPASSAYRSLFVTRVGAAVNAVHPDALHMDVSGPMFNDGNGLIEGMNYAQGSAQLHQDLIAAFPSLAIGGESENDLLYRYQSFAQAGFYPTITTPGHPIADFLFSPQVEFYGHLGQPVATDPVFRSYLSTLEHRAIVPSIAVWSTADLDLAKPDNARLIALLQSWQNNAFQPDWNSNWGGALVRYSGAASTTAVLTDSGTLERLTGAGTTLYEFAHDVNRLTTSSFIPNWLAFDSGTIYGLDESKKYFLDPLARPTYSHIASLPDGYRVGTDALVTSNFAHFQVTSSAKPSYDFYGGFFLAESGILFQGNSGPIADGAEVGIANYPAGGVSRQSLLIRPPFSQSGAEETYVQFQVPVSAGGQLRFSVGIRDSAATCNVDGVTFRVTANGTEVYKQTFAVGAWHDGTADLSAYANSTITLRLIGNPGPQNNTVCDPGLWSQLDVVYPTVVPIIPVPVALGNGSSFSGFAGDGSFSLTSALSGTVTDLPIPGSFTVFTQPGSAVSSGSNLATLPFELSSAFHNEFAVQGSSVTFVGDVSSAIAGGVIKSQGIFAHPPHDGRTLLSWVLKLPSDTPLRLGWSAGILDGAMSADGVDFSVSINGITYWQLTQQADVWTSGTLDLQQWRGQSILLQLITDSRPNSDYDWADWADLVLSPSNVQCALTLPSQVIVGAQGGPLSFNFTAPAPCPWVAMSKVPWITVQSGGPGVGNGTVNYTVDQNASSPRSGILVIAGQSLRVIQANVNGDLPPRARQQITSQ